MVMILSGSMGKIIGIRLLNLPGGSTLQRAAWRGLLLTPFVTNVCVKNVIHFYS